MDTVFFENMVDQYQPPGTGVERHKYVEKMCENMIEAMQKVYSLSLNEAEIRAGETMNQIYVNYFLEKDFKDCEEEVIKQLQPFFVRKDGQLYFDTKRYFPLHSNMGGSNLQIFHNECLMNLFRKPENRAILAATLLETKALMESR